MYRLCPKHTHVQTCKTHTTHHIMCAPLFPPLQRLQDVLTLGAPLQVDLHYRGGPFIPQRYSQKIRKAWEGRNGINSYTKQDHLHKGRMHVMLHVQISSSWNPPAITVSCFATRDKNLPQGSSPFFALFFPAAAGSWGSNSAVFLLPILHVLAELVRMRNHSPYIKRCQPLPGWLFSDVFCVEIILESCWDRSPWEFVVTGHLQVRSMPRTAIMKSVT